jgi:hypothetical protein
MNETAKPAPSPVANAPIEWFGRANRLSRYHVGRPVIDEAIAVSERKVSIADKSFVPDSWPPPSPPACALSSGQLIRPRRSAVDFDGVTIIARETFLAILDTTLPRASAPPFDAWPFSPRIHLVLFVHRVTGLDPGMYLRLAKNCPPPSLFWSLHNVLETPATTAGRRDLSVLAQAKRKKRQANHNSGRARPAGLGHVDSQVKRVMPGPLKKVRPR